MPKISDQATKQDLKVLKADLKEEIAKFKNEIMNGIDKVMGELEAMRQENTLGVHQTSELWEKVDGHEKRITKLESA